jgi:hypothetical protein
LGLGGQVFFPAENRHFIRETDELLTVDDARKAETYTGDPEKSVEREIKACSSNLNKYANATRPLCFFFVLFSSDTPKRALNLFSHSTLLQPDRE